MDEQIYRDVLMELKHQLDLKALGKFKYVPTDPEASYERIVAWITEELGEAATEVNDMTNAFDIGKPQFLADRRDRLRKELIQVIALSWGFIKRVDADGIAAAKGGSNA